MELAVKRDSKGRFQSLVHRAVGVEETMVRPIGKRFKVCGEIYVAAQVGCKKYMLISPRNWNRWSEEDARLTPEQFYNKYRKYEINLDDNFIN